ncbi:MAG: hypothetical protein HPY45_14855 [Anaerolineae bacterium]|nr:hypothetical protein [Anaerolineae bacterium]
MTYSLNQNCHITLTHPNVNSGDPYGFILHSEDRDRGPAVSIQRTTSADGDITIKIFFSVLLADQLINPDGSEHTDTRAEMYSKILEYLAQTSGLELETSAGVFSNVGASGHSATEIHFAPLSIITCQFNNAGTYYPPADPDLYLASVWDGSLTWATSFWRNA